MSLLAHRVLPLDIAQLCKLTQEHPVVRIRESWQKLVAWLNIDPAEDVNLGRQIK